MIWKTLNSWRRDLTLIGNIQIVQSYYSEISIKVLKVVAITVPEVQVQEINKLINLFIWKGNDKVKQSRLINDINNSRLKMLHIQSMICAQRVMLKKFAV